MLVGRMRHVEATLVPDCVVSCSRMEPAASGIKCAPDAARCCGHFTATVSAAAVFPETGVDVAAPEPDRLPPPQLMVAMPTPEPAATTPARRAILAYFIVFVLVCMITVIAR